MLIDGVRGDLRIGFRVLVREKAFCALAVIVLALGIGGGLQLGILFQELGVVFFKCFDIFKIGRVRLLVVDDDPLVRDALTMLLSGEGFEVFAAEDGV